MRIAALDIETSPAQVYTFQLDRPFISLDQVIEPSRMLCFAAQFSDRRNKAVEFYAEWDEGGHEEMVRQAWRILDEADVVMHYNGKRFDTKWLNTEFVRQGLKPPSPYREIDLYQETKKFYLLSHKLQHVSTHLVDTGGKVQHSGFSLWRGVLAGDEKARRTMRRYNIGDIRPLWLLFEELKPWLNSIPNSALYGAPDGACTRCGSTNVQSRGLQHTALSTFRRFQCQDCAGWFRSNVREAGAKSTGVAA